MKRSRREFLNFAASMTGIGVMNGVLHPSIQRALAIPPRVRSGTIHDVDHIVILTQENRSFDHYFGALNGVRGFADPFPIPVADRLGFHAKNVWYQPNAHAERAAVLPFHLDTTQHFAYERVEGTPHSWVDAQHAWDHGRMNCWTLSKTNHSMGFYAEKDIPFQWALADAFTICDAYHCSIQAGTNPNRLFIWTGTNDPLALGHGPATHNDYDTINADVGGHGGYTWMTYAERLENAGVSWQVYQDMDDNFTDNPLVGFRMFRDVWHRRSGHSRSLRNRGISTRDLDQLKDDVLQNRLPQVSWIVATAEGSEHPAVSSPARGAAYTARVIDALTANPDVWSRTVLLLNFDENDGFFDHVPPPAPPSRVFEGLDSKDYSLAGASTVDTRGEYHERLLSYHDKPEERALQHRPYGLGPRVPLYIVSPWSKGGWVNSQVFDHTSIIRFLELRFGVVEPNISPWRRAVCGDLSSAFDFAHPQKEAFVLPDTSDREQRARSLDGTTVPTIPSQGSLPHQEGGVRASRALPYELQVHSSLQDLGQIELSFENTGSSAAVFHVYDRLRLDLIPRRYTVESGKVLRDAWVAHHQRHYDLWILGPNGFHRHLCGKMQPHADDQRRDPEVRLAYNKVGSSLVLSLINGGSERVDFTVLANKYYEDLSHSYTVPVRDVLHASFPLSLGPWYDVSVLVDQRPAFLRRFAGRMETGRDSFSDPAMEGPARGDQMRSMIEW